jgi:hypothetical protein
MLKHNNRKINLKAILIYICLALILSMQNEVQSATVKKNKDAKMSQTEIEKLG